MRFPAIAAALLLCLVAFMPDASKASVGPSVLDVVQFKTILQPLAHDDAGLRQQTSPDGTRVFIVTRKPDVASDANRYEILLLNLSPERLEQRRPAPPEVVFSFDARFDNEAGYPALAQVQWVGERTLVFRAKIKNENFQIYSLDLPTRKLAQLTNVSTPIASFAVSRDLRRLVYALQVANPPLKEGMRSITVGNQWFRSVLYGQHSLKDQLRKYRFYVQDVGVGRSPRPLGEPFLQANQGWPQADISPDGRWAILPRYERERTASWSRQYPLLEAAMKEYGPAMKRDPLGYFNGPMAFMARRMVAWRLEDGQEQSVVDAPDDALLGGSQSRPDKVWHPSGRSLVLAGTHLPVATGIHTSTASHVIEYWPDENRWAVVAGLSGRLERAVASGDGLEVVDSGKRRWFQRIDGGSWREVPSLAPAPRPAWTLRQQEGLNEPPDIVADGPDGQTVRLTTLNPQFDPRTWGQMQSFAWRDAKGRAWQGGLLTPSDQAPGKRLPLVIQSYAYYPQNFYLDGPNSAARGGKSAFPGRAFVREGMLVLAMRSRPLTGSFKDDAQQSRLFYDGVRGAVRALVREGRVDPSRVGIIGWSATGEKVLNLITFSGLPVRAATIADGDASTLFSYAITYGFTDATWGHKETVNGGIAAGAGLAAWVDADPALHTDCIKTALRIESYGATVHNHWDVYALLRRQYKPADLILIPGGSHGLSTPSERMVSLQGNVDWFKFWLRGEKRSGPLLSTETEATLSAQYDAWDQMAVLKRADDRRPRCAMKDIG